MLDEDSIFTLVVNQDGFLDIDVETNRGWDMFNRDYNVEVVWDVVEINYCPMCGKKLE